MGRNGPLHRIKRAMTGGLPYASFIMALCARYVQPARGQVELAMLAVRPYAWWLLSVKSKGTVVQGGLALSSTERPSLSSSPHSTSGHRC